jgi:anti-sigma factor (TIGR02949 family)
MDSSSPDDTRLDCAAVVRSLWEYLDGRASAELVGGIEEHLDRCEGCRAHFAFEERLVQTIAALRREHSDPARLREAVLRALRDAGLGETGES